MLTATRSLLALVLGFAVVLGIFVGCGRLLENYTSIGSVQWHSYPGYTAAGLVTTFARWVVSLAAGGFVASWIAQYARVWHAAIVGLCFLVPNLFDLPSFGPLWFPIVYLAAIVPACLAGGVAARSLAARS